MKTLDAHTPVENGTRRRRTRRSTLRVAMASTVAVAGFAGATVSGIGGASAATNPFERGPAPTTASIEASTGSFATSKTSVSSLVTGFGGGTIYYPTTTASGTFGAVVVTPG